MQFDPNQIQSVKDCLPKTTVELLLNPTATTVGNAIDGIASIICYPLLALQQISKSRLEQFAREIRMKNEKIPPEYRDSSKIGLAIKAIEDAKYLLNEEDIRKMYVNLIASTIDRRKNDMVNPRLASVVAQFGHNEAKLVDALNLQEDHLLLSSQLWAYSKSPSYDHWISQRYFFISKECTYSYNSSIDVLRSLGIINNYNDRHLTADKYTNIYKKIDHKIITEDLIGSVDRKESVRFKEGYIELSSFGMDLIKCINS